MRTERTALLLLTALLVSCEQFPARGWQLARLRVLGARTEAAGEPARASLAPGESGLVTWLVAGPTQTPPLDWASALCIPPGGAYAEPRCETPIALDHGASSDAFARMTVTAPVDANEDLLLLVAFCVGGGARLDPTRFTASCATGEALLASTTIAVGTRNLNPELTDDAARLGGARRDVAWPADCVAGALPLGPPLEFPIDVLLREADREPLDEGAETLVVSSFVDVGTLDRQFSVQEQPPFDRATFTFTPPPTAATARFIFVLRDGRGGTAFAQRTLCLSAPPRGTESP